MKAINLINASRTLATGQDEYSTLDIMDANVDGANCMFSVWEPSKEEIEALSNGGKIQLGIMGGVHPPVFLMVQDENAKLVGEETPEEPDEESGIIV